MNALWQTPVALLALLAWLAAPSRTIGEAAQREALRRQMTQKSSVVLTNVGQPPEIPLVTAAVTPPPDEPPPVIDPRVTAPPTPPVVTPPLAGAVVQDEKWWRARVTAASDALDRDQMMVTALQSRINALERDAVNVDDPIQQTRLRQELQRTLLEQDATKKRIEDDQKAILAIQEEARRKNIPPGWIR